MVAHKAVGIYVELELLLGDSEVFEEFLVVGFVYEDSLAAIAAGGDVIQQSFALQSIRA